MEHRPVRRRAAAEVMTPDDALETLAAADADHVDTVSVVEDAIDEHLLAWLGRPAVVLGALYQFHFAAYACRWHARLLVMPVERLAHARRALFDEAQLHGFVAVGRRRLRLDDNAGPRL